MKVASARGFTLIELVITVLVSAILSIGLLNYIADSVDGYASAGYRNQLASSGRTVIDRIALELHNAVPNSIRIKTDLPTQEQCLEFVPFLGATSYIDPPFTGAGGTEFDVVIFNPAISQSAPDPDPQLNAGRTELYAVIYPINTEALYQDATVGPVALIESLQDHIDTAGLATVTLAETHRFSRRSPVDRMYVVTEPVSFCVVEEQLFRYQDYGFQETQCLPSDDDCLPQTAADGRFLISDSLTNNTLIAFELLPQTLRRNAMVAMELIFRREQDEVRLKHEVLIRNVP